MMETSYPFTREGQAIQLIDELKKGYEFRFAKRNKIPAEEVADVVAALYKDKRFKGIISANTVDDITSFQVNVDKLTPALVIGFEDICSKAAIVSEGTKGKKTISNQLFILDAPAEIRGTTDSELKIEGEAEKDNADFTALSSALTTGNYVGDLPEFDDATRNVQEQIHELERRIENLDQRSDSLKQRKQFREAGKLLEEADTLQTQAAQLLDSLTSKKIQAIQHKLEVEFGVGAQAQPIAPETISTTAIRLRIDLDSISELNETEVAELDPATILGRVIAAEAKGDEIKDRVVGALNKRFPGLMVGSRLNVKRTHEIVSNIDQFWGDRHPIRIETKNVSEVKFKPETAERDELDTILEQAEQATSDLEALKMSGSRLSNIRGDIVALAHANYTDEELFAISDVLGERYSAFRAVNDGEVLNRDGTFDQLARAFYSLGTDQQKELLTIYKNAQRGQVTDSYSYNNDLLWIQHRVTYSVKPKDYQTPEKYDEFQVATLFDLAELTRDNIQLDAKYDADDYGERMKEVSQYMHDSLSKTKSLDALGELDNAFVKFKEQMLLHLSKEKNYLRALYRTKRYFESESPSGWKRMTTIIHAIKHLDDIGFSAFRKVITDVAGDQAAQVEVEFDNLLPEVQLALWKEARFSKDFASIPRAISGKAGELFSMKSGETTVLNGPNAAGKTVSAKTIGDPFTHVIGIVKDGNFVETQGGMKVGKRLVDRPIGILNLQGVTSENRSSLEKQAELLLKAVLDGASIVDETIGTPPEWKVAINVAARLLTVLSEDGTIGIKSLITHMPQEEVIMLKALLGDKRFSKFIPVNCQMRDGPQAGQIVTLSGGIPLTAELACHPDYLADIGTTAKELGLNTSFPPEHLLLADYIARTQETDGTENGQFMRRTDLKYLGLERDGEIAQAVSQGFWEACQEKRFNIPTRSILDHITYMLSVNMPEVTDLWMNQPERKNARKNLMTFFLPSNPNDTQFEVVRQLKRTGVGYGAAKDNLTGQEMKKHFQNMTSLVLLAQVLEGSHALISFLAGNEVIISNGLGRYCEELSRLSFFNSPGMQVFLKNAASEANVLNSRTYAFLTV